MEIMNGADPVSKLLDSAFTRVDRNQDGKLNADEYKSFYEVLKAGVAIDESGAPQITEQDYRGRMDSNSDGEVTRSEMHSVGVLMPADYTENSLEITLRKLIDQTIQKL